MLAYGQAAFSARGAGIVLNFPVQCAPAWTAAAAPHPRAEAVALQAHAQAEGLTSHRQQQESKATAAAIGCGRAAAAGDDGAHDQRQPVPMRHCGAR